VLLADRFIRDVGSRCGGKGRAFDLATAEEVRLVECVLPTAFDDRARAEWRDGCQEALDAWHLDRETLIDYAEVGHARGIEAYVEPSAPAGLLTMRWLPQPATVGVCAALDDDRDGPLRRLFVRAPPGAGFSSWLRLLAREARLRGFVPVCPAAVLRWPQVLQELRDRSVVLLADRCADAPTLAREPPGTPAVCAARVPAASGDSVARVLLLLTQAQARVCAVICRAPRASPRPMLQLARQPVRALAGAVIRAPAASDMTQVSLEVLARQAEGLPGRFVALLDQSTDVARPCPSRRRVAEPATAYALVPGRAASNRDVRDDSHPPQADMSIAIADAWNLFGRHAPVIRDIEGLVARGRWAGAVRALRAHVAANTRRGAWVSAAVASLALARLHLTRCEIVDADRWCREAGEAAARAPDELIAAEALHWTGLIALEQAELDTSDRALRMALLAAEQQGHRALHRQIEISLGRCLFWQGQIGMMSAACELQEEAVDGVPVPPAIRLQAARLAIRRDLARGELSDAGATLSEAFAMIDVGGSTGANQAFPPPFDPHEQRDWRGVLLTDRARILLAAGDVEQCRRSLDEALTMRPTPARMARIRLLRMVCDQREPSDETRRRIARLMRVFLQSRMPRLLRLRARYLTEPESRRSVELAAFIDRYGETALAGRISPAYGGSAVTATHYRTLLQMSHERGDERSLLARICAFVRREVDAAYVGIYGGGSSSSGGGKISLASSGQTRLASPGLAARVIDTAQPITPSAAADALEAGAPMRAQGQVIGAIVCRWIIDSTIDRPLATLLLPAAADAAAPHVQAIFDRDRRSVVEVPAGTRPAHALPPAQQPARMLGVSTPIVALRESIARTADAPFNVLIEGESGSGKELVARALHQQSVRRARRFCAVNCAALSDDLLEAELFGHARGAFTGALTERVGLFEEAHDGTLFLDEIGELSARAQAKLLRAIQDGEIRRLGENLPRRVHPRIVAATNRTLHQEVAAGRFRSDLLYRLDVIRVRVPPLRERIEDIPVLARAFWEQALARARTGSRATLGPDTLAAFARYDWPGNVRELQNVIARLAVQAPARGRVTPQALPPSLLGSMPMLSDSPLSETLPLARARRAFEEQYVRAAIARAGGHLRHAARDLGVSRQGLNKLLARLAIETVNAAALDRPGTSDRPTTTD
jgi:transcriptional regulator with GAF, ATPase, and Fis domain